MKRNLNKHFLEKSLNNFNNFRDNKTLKDQHQNLNHIYQYFIINHFKIVNSYDFLVLVRK